MAPTLSAGPTPHCPCRLPAQPQLEHNPFIAHHLPPTARGPAAFLIPYCSSCAIQSRPSLRAPHPVLCVPDLLPPSPLQPQLTLLQLATQLTAAVKTAFEAGGNLPPAKVAGKAAAKESECCGKKEVTGECCGAQAKVRCAVCVWRVALGWWHARAHHRSGDGGVCCRIARQPQPLHGQLHCMRGSTVACMRGEPVGCMRGESVDCMRLVIAMPSHSPASRTSASSQVKEVAGSCCAKQGTSLSTPQLVLVGLVRSLPSSHFLPPTAFHPFPSTHSIPPTAQYTHVHTPTRLPPQRTLSPPEPDLRPSPSRLSLPSTRRESPKSRSRSCSTSLRRCS